MYRSQKAKYKCITKEDYYLYPLSSAGADYDAFTSSLVFPSGSTPGAQMCFDIQQFISDDQFVEFTENFRIMLSTNDSSAEFTPGRDCATVSINDNNRMQEYI